MILSPEKKSIAVSSQPGDPTWEVAYLFPMQGTWTEREYFGLSNRRRVEFSGGTLEVLAMPTEAHEFMVLFLYRVLYDYVRAGKLGTVLTAGLKVRLWEGKFRMPDVLFMRAEHSPRRGNEFWDGADLVMEVVSDEDRRRDLEVKRFEYARGGIPEYWIVDPQERRVTVLTLASAVAGTYAVHGEFSPGQRAASVLLPGFEVDVTALFAEAEQTG